LFKRPDDAQLCEAVASFFVETSGVVVKFTVAAVVVITQWEGGGLVPVGSGGGGGSGISRVEEKKGFPRIYLVMMPAPVFARTHSIISSTLN